MAAKHVYQLPPAGAAADWTMPQNWEHFTPAEHAVWDQLIERQSHAVAGMACDAFLSGLDILKLPEPGIPDLAELNPRLRAATGWEIVPVPGVIPNEPFFRHLSERRFPAANFLRAADALDYSQEPDMFHDLFGHLPMLADPVFADFMVAYGKRGFGRKALMRSINLAGFTCTRWNSGWCRNTARCACSAPGCCQATARRFMP